MDDKPPALALDALTKSFPGPDGLAAIFADVTLAIDRGESLALTGESGSGKSTLLHCAAGLETPDAGRILVGGVNLTGLGEAGRAELRRDQLGIVFQQFNLIPSLNVAANIAFQARLSGQNDAVWCTALAGILGLEDHLSKFPEELSGGQQQRVAIARALAPRPALVLADEPTGNLDEATGDAVIDLMLGLVADLGAALLIVTHSPRIAERCDRRLHLSRGTLS